MLLAPYHRPHLQQASAAQRGSNGLVCDLLHVLGTKNLALFHDWNCAGVHKRRDGQNPATPAGISAEGAVALLGGRPLQLSSPRCEGSGPYQVPHCWPAKFWRVPPCPAWTLWRLLLLQLGCMRTPLPRPALFQATDSSPCWALVV